jgi:hypothetical protein
MEPTGNCISCVHWFFFKETSTLTLILSKQGVAPSSRVNARRHVPEAEEGCMDVDDVAPTDSGML